MKYIRTKDNIFEVENESPNHIIFCKPRRLKMLVEIDENVYEMKNIIIEREIGKDHWKTEIVKQADTIKELCDEYVVYAEDYGYFNPTIIHRHWVFDNIEEAKEQIKLIGNGIKRIIYGAIWTKGEHDEPILKSVAKMNEKGNLKLL